MQNTREIEQNNAQECLKHRNSSRLSRASTDYEKIPYMIGEEFQYIGELERKYFFQFDTLKMQNTRESGQNNVQEIS